MTKSKANGFMKWLRPVSEDIIGGPIPDEISYKGYTTKNLHHSEDARRAFLATIQRAEAGQIHADSTSVLDALKATDTYMGLNDLHLEQQKELDPDELRLWNQSHQDARKYLNHIGEFAHHMDYWHTHEHELQDLMGNYNLETAGAEMVDSYTPEGNQLDEASEPQVKTKTSFNDEDWYEHHPDTKVIRRVHKVKSPEARHFRMMGASEYKTDDGHRIVQGASAKNMGLKEDVQLDETLTDKTIRSGDKVKVARVIADMLGVENAESMSPDASINAGLRKIKNKRMTPELVGVLTKMLKLAQDVGVKVDMSLVPTAMRESLDEVPEVDTGTPFNGSQDVMRLRDFMALEKTYQNKHGKVGHSMHSSADGDDKDHVRKMKVKYKTEELNVDESFTVKDAKGKVVHTTYSQSAAEKKAKELSDASGQKHSTEFDRQANVKEDMASADYKISPETGRKYRAHRIDFKNSGTKGKLLANTDNKVDEQVADSADKIASVRKKADMMTRHAREKETLAVRHDAQKDNLAQEEIAPADDFEILDLADHELDAMVNEFDFEDMLDEYDEDDITLVDLDTGEEVDEEEDQVDEAALMEVLSRIERMKARIRFLRTRPLRQRRTAIALKRRSDTKTLTKRARRLAIKMLKQRIAKKPVSQMSISEKERVERMIQARKGIIDKLAMRMMPRVRKIESDRLTPVKSASPATAGG